MTLSVESVQPGLIARLAWRMFRRDAARGQFAIIFIAVAVAVAGMTAVGMFTGRVHAALERQAGTLLAADLVLLASDGIPDSYRDRARSLGLNTTETLTLRSMVGFEDQLQLVEVKAVTAGYPLRGQLETAETAFGTPVIAHEIPDSGTVWVDSRLLQMFDARVGDTLEVGASRLQIGAVLVYEPDRGGDLFNIAPRLMMNLDDLVATRLIVPGSRKQHSLLVAGSGLQIETYRSSLQLPPQIKLVAPSSARPEIRTALDHAEQFLSLAALVAVVLAGVAIMLAARSFADEHLDMVALLRTLGASRSDIARLFTVEILLLGVLASCAGALAGVAAHCGLIALTAGWAQGALPPASPWPAARGLFTGLAALVGFGLPPLLKLRDVPPLRVLRHDVGWTPPRRVSVLLYGAATLALLAPWQVGAWRVTLWALAGLAGSMLILAGFAALILMLLSRVRSRVAVQWRAGLANLARRRRQSVLQILALGLGIMVMLLLAVIRTDLMDRWQRSLPATAPDQFVINIQPTEVDRLRGFFAAEQLPIPEFYPMVRARLVTINDQPVNLDSHEDPRARRLLDREFNLSSAKDLKPDNRIVAGAWWSATPITRQFSMELGIADTLGIKLGDRLGFTVADQRFSAAVTSLREVNWDSMQVNFFVVASPGTLQSYPATFISSFKLPATDNGFLTRLVHAFPNLTLIDVAAMIRHVRGIMTRAATAIEYVFMFTIIAGMVVLVAAVQSTQAARVYDSTLFKALGAPRSLIVRMISIEFLVIGGIAGGIAGLGAIAVGFVLAQHVLHVDYVANPWVFVIGTLTGIVGVVIAGVYAITASLREPPVAVLRRLG